MNIRIKEYHFDLTSAKCGISYHNISFHDINRGNSFKELFEQFTRYNYYYKSGNKKDFIKDIQYYKMIFLLNKTVLDEKNTFVDLIHQPLYQKYQYDSYT